MIHLLRITPARSCKFLRQIPPPLLTLFNVAQSIACFFLVEWHPGELCPRVGFIVTNLARPAERVVRSTASVVPRSNGSKRVRARSSGRGCRAAPSPPTRSASSFMPSPTTLAISCERDAMPKAAEPWSLTSLRERLLKIDAKVVNHGRYVTFQLSEVVVSRKMFADILSLILRLGVVSRSPGLWIGARSWRRSAPSCRCCSARKPSANSKP
jgi:hypothetical protein